MQREGDLFKIKTVAVVEHMEISIDSLQQGNHSLIEQCSTLEQRLQDLRIEDILKHNQINTLESLVP
jgi:hypothetical protein